MDIYNLPSDKTFLISAKAVVVKDGKVLLLKNIDDKWELSGGLVELDEEPEEALIRECKEETTLEIQVDRPFDVQVRWWKRFKFKNGDVKDVRQIGIGYICTTPGGEVVLSDEHTDFKWVEGADLGKLDLALISGNLVHKYFKEIVK